MSETQNRTDRTDFQVHPMRAHVGVIPETGSIGSIRRLERFGASRLTVTPSSGEQHDAYRAGLCVDCRTVPYSAGRPRCADCHGAYQKTLAGYDW